MTRFSFEPGWEQDYLREPGVRTVEVSHDGTRILYAAEGGGLALRDLSQTESRPIPGTARLVMGAFSPDDEWILYGEAADVIASLPQPPFAIRRIPVTGGVPITLAEGLTYENAPAGQTWDGAERLLLLETNQLTASSRILRMPAAGGTPEVLFEGRDEFLGKSDAVARRRMAAAYQACRWRILVTRTRQRSSFSRCGRRSGGSWSFAVRDPRYLPTGHLVYVQGEHAARCAVRSR